MKAIGYVRVSTEEQARHGISLDMQRTKISRYAELEDMELVQIIADEGISGSTIKARPGIQHVLRLARRREVEAVIVFKLDRLARNTIEALETAQLMDRKGVALHSICERLDTQSAIGRFFFTLMASLAEMERAVISERIQAAMDRKKERGEARNNNPSYGLRVVAGKLVPDHGERRVIERILCLRQEGKTIHQIVHQLALEGVENRKGGPSEKHKCISSFRDGQRKDREESDFWSPRLRAGIVKKGKKTMKPSREITEEASAWAQGFLARYPTIPLADLRAYAEGLYRKSRTEEDPNEAAQYAAKAEALRSLLKTL